MHLFRKLLQKLTRPPSRRERVKEELREALRLSRPSAIEVVPVDADECWALRELLREDAELVVLTGALSFTLTYADDLAKTLSEEECTLLTQARALYRGGPDTSFEARVLVTAAHREVANAVE